MRDGIFLIIVLLNLCSCTGQDTKHEVKEPVSTTKMSRDFTFENKAHSVTTNGEQIYYHKNGMIEMRGLMKNNKREGVWKSWYESGLPWSETTFKDGKKNGPTTTWYENGNKRYEGFFTDDRESGRWVFWKDNGEIVDSKNYDIR